MDFATQLKLGRLAHKLLPRPAINLLKSCAQPWLIARTRKAFDKAPTSPAWLGPVEFASLMQKYPPMKQPPSETDPASDFLAADLVLRDLALPPNKQRLLEVGLGNGMVAAAMHARGKSVVGIDLVKNVHPRALEAGVEFHEMDACDLDFPDASFDAVYSFNALEHIHDPQAALREAARVTRPGGRIFLGFAPLYMSAWGLHASQEIGIPYCQHLFPKEILKTVIKSDGFWYLNEWRVNQYRHLWQSLRPMLRPRHYIEEMDLLSLELIRTYPSCFKSKSLNLDDFLVSGIRVTFDVLPTKTPIPTLASEASA